MKESLYTISGWASRQVELTREQYRDALSLLEKVMFSDLVMRSIPSEAYHTVRVSEETAGRVFQHLIHRTLAFQKVVECVRIREIVSGIPSLGIEGVWKNDSKVRSTLGLLEAYGVVFKIHLCDDPCMLIGVNLPKVFEILCLAVASWKLRKPSRAIFNSLRDLRRLASQLTPKIDHFEALYAPSHTWNRAELKNALTARFDALESKRANSEEMAMGTLKENIDRVRPEIARKEYMKIEKMTLWEISPDSTRGVKAALAYWHKCVLDTGLYPEYYSTMFGAHLRCMKWFLAEQFALGKTEFDIKETIRYVVDNWPRVAGNSFTRTVVSKDEAGSVYLFQETVIDSPKFDYFYVHRAELIPKFEHFQKAQQVNGDPEPIEFDYQIWGLK